MIQRIQSLYLLMALTMVVLTLFLPFVILIVPDTNVFYLYVQGIYNAREIMIYQTWPMLILMMVIGLMYFINIFLYRKRVLQMRLCVYNVILLFGLIGLMVFYLYQVQQLVNVQIYYRYGLILPLIAIILTILAFRGIRRDEILIRSADRLR